MAAQVKTQKFFENPSVFKGLGILLGVTLASGILSAACLANSASQLMAGTSFGSFVGERANEKVGLGIFAITASLCGVIWFLRSLYFADKGKVVTSAL